MPASDEKAVPSEVLHGIGVSPGVVVGPAFILASEISHISETTIASDQVYREVSRLEEALIETRRQLHGIQEDLRRRGGGRDATILDAHLMVLDDRAFLDEIMEGIQKKRRNAESVMREVSEQYAAVLASVADDYLRERVADVKDVARRLIRNLSGHVDSRLEDLKQRQIVVASDLAPSETASLRTDMVMAFVTDLGSPTSHTAVMARALEIPAIVGLRDVTARVAPGDQVLVDGNRGVLILNPSEADLEKYGRVAESRRHIVEGLSGLKDEPAVTRDGRAIKLSANIEGPSEAEAVIKYGGKGIGLFRSEYLYLASDRILGEMEQAEAYTSVARRLAPEPVIIRTLDLGGDKVMPDADHPYEANPFLGCRSIRFSLMHTEEFKVQLRAILRASELGNVQIMYPMISNVGEVIKANELVEEAKDELRRDGVPFDDAIRKGAMVEIPSAALTADIIAERVDFMSIGTNDLVQYTLAVDRVNERVAYLYEPTHPAVLRLISMTVEAGHRHGIWVGLCGEMAADPIMTPLLVGLELDELSVAPSALPAVKDVIRSVDFAETKSLAKQALSCKSAREVLTHCRQMLRQAAPEILELV